MSPAWAGGFFITEPPGKPINLSRIYLFSEAKTIFGCFCRDETLLLKKKESKKENLGMHSQKSIEQEVGDMSL